MNVHMIDTAAAAPPVHVECSRCGRAAPADDSPELDGSRFGLCAVCVAELVEHRPPDRPRRRRSSRGGRRRVRTRPVRAEVAK